ncbi:MAG: hypothetical protein RL033_1106 [Pseudomonadota bacterium]
MTWAELSSPECCAWSSPPIRPEELGVEQAGDDWSGLPLLTRHFDGSGKTSGFVASADTVIVWGGGRSEVTIHHGQEPGAVARRQLSRCSGMIDLLPAGTVLQHIEWHGQRFHGVSVLIPRAAVRALKGWDVATFAPGLPPLFGLFDAHVVDLVRRLESQAVGGQPLGKAYTEALSVTLLTYLAHRYGEGADRAHQEPSLSSAQRRRVSDFVEAHLDGDIRLADLAGLASYSSDHFSRLFKRSFGESPYQYVLRRRVERAKALLRDASLSLADIASACGFATQAHLTNVFKLRTGVTPGAYRRG